MSRDSEEVKEEERGHLLEGSRQRGWQSPRAGRAQLGLNSTAAAGNAVKWARGQLDRRSERKAGSRCKVT